VASPLRVLMVTPEFHPHLGGVETHTLEVARRLVGRADLHVEVLTTDRTGDLPPEDELQGVRIHRVPARPRNADLYWSPAIGRSVRRLRPDLVHCQGYHTFVPIHAMRTSRRTRTPYVVTFHSGGHSSRLRHRLRPLQVRLLRPMLLDAAALVAVSEFEARLFRDMLGGEARIRVIPNGVDRPIQGDSHAARDPELIVSVGRLERYKGHERMIRALPAVRASVPRARLRIVGEGPYASDLLRIRDEEGLADAVEIGPVPRTEMEGLLRTAGVAVVLSEYESHGLAAHEALAAGCRLVVTDGSALSELAAHPAVEAIPASADAAALAAAVVRGLGHAAGGDAQVPVGAAISWDECANRLAALYEKVSSSPRP
jgi:glycosyltransferase involved in cell wall biosynthesis